MGFRLQQLPEDGKFVQALHFEVLEQLCPRELVSELLTRCQAWEERERRLNHLIVVYDVIALSLFRRQSAGRGVRPPGGGHALALVQPVSEEALGGCAGLPSSATGYLRHAPPVPAGVPSHGYCPDQGSFPLRLAAHGHRTARSMRWPIPRPMPSILDG